MTVEEFFQNYDPAKKYVYRNDKWVITQISHVCVRPWQVIHVPNAHAVRNFTKPKARQDLPIESQNEGIYCGSCHDTVSILRATSKLTSSYLLSTQYSNYLPQQLKYCNCRALAALVDNRGTLRVYGDLSNISLVNYLEGFPIHHRLLNQRRAGIPKELLDPPRVSYTPASIPRYMWETNFIDLSYLPERQQDILLPVQKSSMPRRHYHMAYAYRHKIAILTKKYLILPNGVLVLVKDPYLKQLLDQPSDAKMHHSGKNTLGSLLRSAKVNYQLLQESTKAMSLIIDSLIRHYNLPEATTRLLPFQIIGHMQASKVVYWEASKGYMSYQYIRATTLARNEARRAIRCLLLEMPYTPNVRNLEPPPPSAFAYTSYLLKKPPVTHPPLRGINGALRLP